MDFTPSIFPEMTVYFEYIPEEMQTWDHPGCQEEFEFYKIEINDKEIGQDLEEHLIDFYGDDWAEELGARRFGDD